MLVPEVKIDDQDVIVKRYSIINTHTSFDEVLVEGYLFKAGNEKLPQKLGRDELVQSVLAHFDFDKVQKVMHALNWKWVSSKSSNQIPTIPETVLLAKTYLEMAYDGLASNKTDRYSCGSGGFKAVATRYEDGEIVLELDFAVTAFNWSSQDTCY